MESGKKGIRNGDVKLLESLFDIMGEVVSVEKRSEWTYERLYSITRHITGMPMGGGNAPGMDGVLAEVEELNGLYKDRLNVCITAMKKAERILNGIENQRMRTFVQMCYIDRVPKAEIMREMDMSEYGFNKCREQIEGAESMKAAIWPERE